ncbi:FAD-binding oxidoreductase [Lentisalinibacter salinarum]|uniref:FAD-binding oxidoreductase n=1 Tax=Lentisalinibacter salinarum TaxID=2992239 RepID=UPI00386FFF68
MRDAVSHDRVRDWIHGDHGNGRSVTPRRAARRTPAPPVARPESPEALRDLLRTGSGLPAPLRPMGAGSASTPCSVAEGGTVIDMTGLDGVLEVGDEHVTVQAGLRLQRLADELAGYGLELAGGHDLMGRTVGGAVAGACIGPGTGVGTRLFSSQVVSMKVVTPEGGELTVDASRPHLLDMFRLSYGLLGVIHEVTLRVRPMSPFTIRRRRCSTAELAAVSGRLLGSKLGLRFYLLPFRDQVYLELRRNGDEDTHVNRLLWKIKDWGESTILPAMTNSMSWIVPIPALRYGMIDRINGAGQTLFSAPVHAGSAAVEQGGARPGGRGGRRLACSSWCFPAAEFPLIVQAYREFCRDYYARTRFRCDMPTVGYRLARDRSALLSPSFDGPVFVLRAVSTPRPQWQDFVLEFADFAEKWNGIPFLDQTDGLSAGQVAASLGSRLEFFRKMRRRLDPDGRLLNPYLAQFFL